MSRRTNDPSRPCVLIVEDDMDLANLYREWLSTDYAIRFAADVSKATDRLDEAVDVVLLDRRMPDGSGDTLLEHIHVRDLPCRVAMVTAVEPDFDIVELGFDDYVTKPVTRDELHAVVDQLLRRATYSQAVQEFFAIVSKKATLEAEKNPAELARSDEYADLVEQFLDSRSRVNDTIDALDSTDLTALFRDFDRRSDRREGDEEDADGPA